MPRELNSNDIEIDLLDAFGNLCTLRLRKPNTEERISYRASQMERDDDDILLRIFETRVYGAARLLTGINADAFTVDGEPLSSTPGHAGYREDWKQRLMDGAPELLEAIGYRLFEATSVVAVRRAPAEDRLKAQAGTKGCTVERVDGPLETGSADS